MIKTSLRARLVTRIRRPPPALATSTAAVDLAAILGLTDVENEGATRATNPNQNADIHERTSTAARKEVAPPARLQAPSPGQHPRATRRLRGAALGLHLFRYRAIAYETATRWATSRPPAARCTDFSGSRRSSTSSIPWRRVTDGKYINNIEALAHPACSPGPRSRMEQYRGLTGLSVGSGNMPHT